MPSSSLFGFVGNDGVSQGLSSNPYATRDAGIARGQMEDSAMPTNHYTANHPAILCRSHWEFTGTHSPALNRNQLKISDFLVVVRNRAPKSNDGTPHSEKLPPRMKNTNTANTAPRWSRAKLIKKLVGISSAQLYRFAQSGMIRTSNLRRPGQTRGVRLYSLTDVEQLIDDGIEIPRGTSPNRSTQNA